jgi:hypothetical protein
MEFTPNNQNPDQPPEPTQAVEPDSRPSSALQSDVLLDGFIPGVVLASPRGAPTRQDTLERKQLLLARLKLLQQQKRSHKSDTFARADAFRRIGQCYDGIELLNRELKGGYVPQHGPAQFLAPRMFLTSRLFRVAGKQLARTNQVDIQLEEQSGVALSYRGPELRQSDGRVFMAILHMLRDVPPGSSATFRARDPCIALFGRYDGNSRRQLKLHIQRLEAGAVTLNGQAISLCRGFQAPASGRWSVSLDAKVPQLFMASPHVWLSCETYLALPEGLATWLYGYVRSQTSLIPTSLELLRRRSGSTALDKPFMNRTRQALRALTQAGAIHGGWSLRDGAVRWMKR